MSRPPCCRLVAQLPPHDHFEPAGSGDRTLEVLHLGLDAFEALRLADVERLPQDEAASRMGVSRQTFGRILDVARTTVARALVEGRALHIEGGPICPPPHPGWRCPRWGEQGPATRGDCPRHRGCPSADVLDSMAPARPDTALSPT